MDRRGGQEGRAGSVYVSVVLAALIAYFAYQSWFNPQRAVKRQLGELAAALSVPADSRGEAERLARTERLGRYFAADARLRLDPPEAGIHYPRRFIAATAAVTRRLAG